MEYVAEQKILKELLKIRDDYFPKIKRAWVIKQVKSDEEEKQFLFQEYTLPQKRIIENIPSNETTFFSQIIKEVGGYTIQFMKHAKEYTKLAWESIIESKGDSLQLLKTELKKDREFVFKVLNEYDANALKYADFELRDDDDFIYKVATEVQSADLNSKLYNENYSERIQNLCRGESFRKIYEKLKNDPNYNEAKLREQARKAMELRQNILNSEQKRKKKFLFF